jgi:hypothetical protein
MLKIVEKIPVRNVLSSDETDESINPHVYCVEEMPGPANSWPETFFKNFKFGPWKQAT